MVLPLRIQIVAVFRQRRYHLSLAKRISISQKTKLEPPKQVWEVFSVDWGLCDGNIWEWKNDK